MNKPIFWKYSIKYIEGYRCKYWIYSTDNIEPFNVPSKNDARLAVNELNRLDKRIEELEEKNRKLQAFILKQNEENTT